MSNHDQELNWFLKTFLEVSLGPYQANFLFLTLAFFDLKGYFCVLEFGQNREKTRVRSRNILMAIHSLFSPDLLGLTNTPYAWVERCFCGGSLPSYSFYALRNLRKNVLFWLFFFIKRVTANFRPNFYFFISKIFLNDFWAVETPFRPPPLVAQPIPISRKDWKIVKNPKNLSPNLALFGKIYP